MSTQRGLVIALVLFVIGLTLFISSQKPPEAGSLGAAPDVPLVLEPEGKKMPLSSLKGHVVILDFWATWCGPCRASIPELEQIYEKYKSKGLEVIGVSLDETTSQPQIPQVAHTLGMTYPIMIAAKAPEISANYGSAGIPMMYVIDKKGDIRKTQQGLDTRRGLADIDELIGQLLQE